MFGLASGDLHSRAVAWAKVTLPLLALVVLSTLFLISNGVNPEDAIPYADVDIESRLQDPRVTAASFAGMTTDGAALTLKAAEARPGTPGTENGGVALGLSGLLETPDGQKTEVTAAEIRLDDAARQLILTGGVSLKSSTGYALATPGLTVALDATDVQSAGAVVATGPIGQISAGAFHLTQRESTAGPRGGYQLVFNQGVRLLYTPPN